MNSFLKNYKIYRLVGISLTSIFGFLSLFGIIGSIFSNDGLNLILGTMILFFPPLAVGIYLFLTANKKLKSYELNQNENLVLNLAAKNNGMLTQAVLAKNSDLNIAEAGQILKELSHQGVASVEVTDEGVIEYHFHGLKKKM